jgi:tRNA 2-thiouridine synthesizing protein A
MIELDCRRLLCPMPVIRTQDHVARMQVGEELRVTCTDPGVMQDIPAWCRINGHTLLNAINEDDEYIITIRVENDGT